MRYFRAEAFKRLFRKLPPTRQESVVAALRAFALALEAGRLAEGLGIKRLRRDVWEFRAGLLDRIVFSRERDIVELLAVGTHDEIKRFLKRH